MFKSKISNTQGVSVSTYPMVQSFTINNNNHNIDADHMETRTIQRTECGQICNVVVNVDGQVALKIAMSRCGPL